MNSNMKSTLVATILVFACALGGGVGVATLIVRPFGYFISNFVGATYIVSAFVCWGWACFAKRELYE